MDSHLSAEQRAGQSSDGHRIAARRDAVWIAVVSAAAAFVCVRFDLSEILLGWTRQHERLQLDELPGVLLVVAACLIWYSSRRYLEARGQLSLRRATEQRLADALAENQRLAQQYVLMQECERKALARDLHDELGQYLHIIKLDAVAIRDAPRGGGARHDATVSGERPIEVTARAVIDNVDRVYAVVGNLIRQLRPAGLDELGLAAALESCVDDWRRRLPGATLRLSLETDLGDLGEEHALAVYRLVQEAMTNVLRHSQATRVDIGIVGRGAPGAQARIEVSIEDNGRGADLVAPRTGLGLVGMRERVAACGGTLRLQSEPGGGFKVLASVPCA